ncbi:glycerophosphoryl diester phosphodiesterase [Pseudomonas sp. TE3786]
MRMFATLLATLACTLSLSSSVWATACISIAGKHLDPADIYDPAHQCGTCAGQAAKPALCGAINRVMVPYWSAPADLIAIPHRGVWGTPIGRGPAENTLGAFQAALNAGHHIVEVDAVLTGPDQSGVKKVFLGHYFNMAAAGGSADKTPRDYNAEQITHFKMRKRDQTLSGEQSDHLALMSELIAWAAQNQVLLMIDPKRPANAEPHEYEKIIAYVLNEANKAGALANIAIKTAHEYAATVADATPFLDQPYASYQGQFLWSPIVSTSRKKALQDTLLTINMWHQSTNASKQVITYETNIYSPQFWGAKPFTYRANNYSNLIDYVKKLTPLGKRSALWSVDAVGDKGTLGREYQWKFIGNTASDKRSNLFTTLSYDLARHVVINTDRPDWYLGMVIDPYKTGRQP